MVVGLLPRLGIAQKQVVTADTYDSTAVYEFRFEGASFQGKILEWTPLAIRIITADFGEVTVLPQNVERILLISTAEEAKDFIVRNPNATRYFFSPSAIPIRKGEGYYQNIYGVANFVNYGITDNISIGGGMELITLLTSVAGGFDFFPLVVLTPKVGIQINEKNAIGAGVIAGGAAGTFAGITYGLYTRGTEDRNFSLGLGYAFADGEFAPSPIMTVSGMYRLNERIFLMTENWLLLDETDPLAVFAYGVRIANNRNSWDLGFINQRDIAEVLLIGVPYVSFVRRF